MDDIVQGESAVGVVEVDASEPSEDSLVEHLASSIDMEIRQLRSAQSFFSEELMYVLSNPSELNLKRSEYPVQYLRGYNDQGLIYEDPEFPDVILTPKEGSSFNCKESRFSYHIMQLTESASNRRLMITSTIFNSAYFRFNFVSNTAEYKQLKKEEEQQTPTYAVVDAPRNSEFDTQESPTAKREELSLNYLGLKFRFSRFVDENMQDHHIELQVEKFNEQMNKWLPIRNANPLTYFDIKDFYTLKNKVKKAYDQAK